MSQEHLTNLFVLCIENYIIDGLKIDELIKNFMTKYSKSKNYDLILLLYKLI